MLFSEKLKRFTAAHPSANLTVGGAQFRYVLSGRENGRPLVFLNRGMNTLEMWMDHVGPLSGDCRVLRFDYPQEPRTDRVLAAGLRPSRTAL